MLKVGDKVVITNTDYLGDELQNGNTGVVSRNNVTKSGKPYVGVLMDNGHAPMAFDPDDDDAWNFFEDQLELAE